MRIYPPMEESYHRISEKRLTELPTQLVLHNYFHRISGNITIAAKLTFQLTAVIVNFSYNYDIATYSVTIKGLH